MKIIRALVRFFRGPVIPCGRMCTDCGKEHAEMAYSKRVMLCESCDLKARAI